MRTTTTTGGDDDNNDDDDEHFHSHDDSDDEWERSEYLNGVGNDGEPQIIMTPRG